MAKSLNIGTLVTFALAVTLFGHTAAETYTVGDDAGWTFANATAYATWASQHNFTVGDVLEFNFVTGSHTVATVTKASFDTCNINSPISIVRNGPASINLTSPGEQYFICTVGQHCTSAFQKLAINVTASSSTPPSTPPSTGTTPSPPSTGGATPSPSPSGGATPSPPPPSAAARTGLVSIFTIFSSAAVYFLF